MVKNLKTSLILTSVIYTIIGIIMLMFPDKVSDYICYMVGLMLLFFGISGVVMFFNSEEKSTYSNTSLILSIVLGAFGIYVFINPKGFASFIPFVIGVLTLVDSMNKLSITFNLRKYGYENWWQMLIVSFIVMALGILLIVNPFAAVTLSIRVIGIVLIVNSVMNLFTIYSYSKIDTK